MRMRMREYGQRTTSAPELIYYAEESKRAVCPREASHAKCGSVRFLPCLQGAALCLCAGVLALMRRFRADASIDRSRTQATHCFTVSSRPCRICGAPQRHTAHARECGTRQMPDKIGLPLGP